MKIKEIIDFLEKKGEWVDRLYTRDRVLYGDDNLDVNQVITCWVATIDVIKEAKKRNCHFIISHENPFYLASTSLHSTLIKAQEEKMSLLKDNRITIYRCHDLWDLYPEYGVRDRWARTLQLSFEEAIPHSFFRVAYDVDMTVEELAHHVNTCIQDLGQIGIQVIGDLKKKVNRLAIGTGACTDVFSMNEHHVDACLVSDDGINNWVGVQWAMDHHIPLIVVNHMTCEAPGMKGLQEYLTKEFPDIKVEFLDNDYGIYHIQK